MCTIVMPRLMRACVINCNLTSLQALPCLDGSAAGTSAHATVCGCHNTPRHVCITRHALPDAHMITKKPGHQQSHARISRPGIGKLTQRIKDLRSKLGQYCRTGGTACPL